MSTSTFRELLSQPTDQVERPKPIADGHYLGEIKSHEFGLSRQKQTPFVRFILTPEEGTGDVDEAANAGIDFSRRELRKDFYITPNSLYRLSDMLDAVLGKQQGRSFDERIPETRGAKVMFQVTHRDNEEGTESYNEVGTILRA
jgi:hypothetical protein